MHRCVGVLVLSTFASLAGAGGAAPLEDAGMFPFVIPWDDATPGTATDVRHLTLRPAGSRGFIVPRDGVFVDGDAGPRIRFLAVNITAGSAFPSRHDADAIAARLAKLGVNLVRFHHLQSYWGKSIWKEGRTFVEIDPARIDELDYFVAALKREGIYTNMNLSTTREYAPELGFPESVKDIPTTHHKKVDRWNRRMIQLQKEYAAALLDRVNPYTGVAYKDEPALAFVEISNEDSIVGWPGETPGQGLDQMPEPFRFELAAQWNEHLAARYANDGALLEAWNDGTGVRGPELIEDGTPLAFENQVDPAAAVHTPLTDDATPHGSRGARVEVREVGADWTVQLHIPHLSFVSGTRYTLRFRARAAPPRPLSFKLHLDRPDWQSHGLQSTVDLDQQWRDFAVDFEAAHTVPGHSRMAFLLGDHAGAVEIEGVRLREGALPFAFAEGQSLAARNLSLAARGATGQRRRDWIDFLADVDHAFAQEMRAYLRDTLGLRANLLDTQIPWGGLTSLIREDEMEWTDNHAYWQHPRFPGAAWDEARWTINQQALVNEMDRGQGALGDLARWRVAGKPYTVSEYNHAAPNDFQSETLPLLASVGAVQDWDALYLFDYPETGQGRQNDAIAGFFDCALNPAKVAFLPSAALIFRAGAIPPALRNETLRLPSIPWADGLDVHAVWRATGGSPDILGSRVAIAAGSGGTASRESEPSEEPVAVRVERHAHGAVVIADAPAAKAITGFVGGQSIATEGMIASFPSFGRNAQGFAAITLVAHDGAPLRSAERLLLTAIGRAENVDMGWNEDRSSVGNDWGQGPVHAEGIPAHVSIERDGLSRVYALDERGRRGAEVLATMRDGQLRFEIGPAHRTVWYEITSALSDGSGAR